MFIPAVLITGGWGEGQSAEIYHPDRDTLCVLPDLPEGRYYHTQDGALLCGGGDRWRERSCDRWNADTGAWDLVTESLTRGREYHTSWTPVDGSVTYLMGERRTSDAIQKNNSVTSSFPLRYNTV